MRVCGVLDVRVCGVFEDLVLAPEDLLERFEETLLIEDFEVLLYKDGGRFVGIGEAGGVVIDTDLLFCLLDWITLGRLSTNCNEFEP